MQYIMFQNLNTWKISLHNTNIEPILLDSYKVLDPLTYLLRSNQSEYSIIEKFVHEIALFHFKRLNIKFDENKYIEFWFKKSGIYNDYHFDCDEYSKKLINNKKLIVPLLSCIVYMDNSKIPTIITNIDKDTYDTKNFKENNTFALSFPKYLKHITFDGGNNLHGMLNYNENDNIDNDRYILAINLWDIKPLYVPYFDYLTHLNKIFVVDQENIANKIVYVDKEMQLITTSLDMKGIK